jgi:hypothetical protein
MTPNIPGSTIPSSNPIHLRDWFEVVITEFADEISALSDRVSDHVMTDIDRSFADGELWQQIAFLAIAGKVAESLSEQVNELMRLRMLEDARQFANARKI